VKKYLQLVKNVGLFVISSIATKLISFFLLPIYTKYLTTTEYATIDMAIVVQSLLWPIFSLALTDGLLRFALDKDYDKKKVFSICNLLIVPGFIGAWVIIEFIKYDEILFQYRNYFFVYYFVVSLNSYYATFARTIGKIKLIVLNSVLSSLLIAGLNIVLLVKFGTGIDGFFCSLILGNAISAFLYFVFGNYINYLGFSKIDKKIAKEILIYSIPMIPNTIFWWINSSLDKFCLTMLIDLSAVGLYSVAGKISSALNLVISVFSQAWSISVFSEYKNNDAEGFFLNVYNFYNFIVLSMAFILILFVKPIASIFFSNDFYVAWKYVPTLVIAFYYSALNTYWGSMFTANKKTNIIFYTTGAGAIVNLILNICLIKNFGVIGAALATAVSNFIVYIIRNQVIRKIVELKTNKLLNISLQIVLVLLGIFTTREYGNVILGMTFVIAIILLLVFFNKNILSTLKKVGVFR